MKNFFKIFLISAAFQITGIIVSLLLLFIMEKNNISFQLSFFVLVLFLFSILMSNYISVSYSIKLQDSLKKKILTIIFMPTNYTLFICLILYAVWYFSFCIPSGSTTGEPYQYLNIT